MGGCYVSEEVIHNNPLQYVTSGLRYDFRGFSRKCPFVKIAVVDITLMSHNSILPHTLTKVNTPIEYIKKILEKYIPRKVFYWPIYTTEGIFFIYQEDIRKAYISHARRTRPFETVRARKIYLRYPSLADWKHF